MWCIQKLKIHFTIFYICGLASYIPLNIDRFEILYVISLFVKSFYISVLSASTIRFINSRFDEKISLNFSEIYSCAVFIHNNIISAFAFYICIRSSNVSRNVCNRFAFIIHRMEQKLQITIPMNQFNKQFAITVFVKIVTIIPAIQSTSESLSYLYSNFVQLDITLFMINQIFLIMLDFYLVFHVNFMGFLMMLINNKLQIHYASRRYTNVASVLYNLKFLHFNLWQISQIINNHFGFLIAMLIIQLLHLIVFGIYETIIGWQSPYIVLSK